MRRAALRSSIEGMKRARTFQSCNFLHSVFFIVVFSFPLTSARAQEHPSFSKILGENGADSALVVYDIDNRKELIDIQGSKPLKPASVLKVLTSAASLALLGPEYRFITEVYAEGRRGTSVPSVSLRGHGDPTLTSESVWLLARRLRAEGVTSIGEVVLDDSLFADSRDPSGQRAFQSGSSALAFNFNSIAFRVCSNGSGKPALVTPDPWETNISLSNGISTTRSGRWSFSIDQASSKDSMMAFVARGTIAAAVGCTMIYRSVKDPVQYLGEFLLPTLRSVGIKVEKGWRQGVSPGRAELLFEHRSKALHAIVEDLNHFSTNFIGEQILYVLGNRGGGPGRYDHRQGARRLEEYLRSLGVSADQFSIVDGSGLEHSNRLSARAVVKILVEMDRSYSVSPEFESSLSVSERSGTLEKREFGIPPERVRGKTGTLDGVSSLAGYLLTKKGKKLAFALLENGVKSKASAEVIEKRIVSGLYNSDL